MNDHKAENSVHLSENTLGDTLLRQILAARESDRANGIEGLLDIVSYLNPLEQSKFFKNLKTSAEFKNSKLLDDVIKKFDRYMPNVITMEARHKEYNSQRAKNYDTIAQFKAELVTAQEALRETEDELREARKAKSAPDIAHLKNRKKNRKKELKKIEHQIARIAKNIKEDSENFKEEIAAFYEQPEKAELDASLKELHKHLKDQVRVVDQQKQETFWADALPQVLPDYFYQSPLFAINHPNPDKLALRNVFEQDPYIADALFSSSKMGGANDPGQYGGNYVKCYQTPEGKVHAQLIFFKQATDHGEPNHRENIAEVIAGRIMNAMIGDNAASTYFAVAPHGKKGNINDVYVASIFYDHFEDANKAAHKALGKKKPKRGGGLFGAQWIDSRAKGNPYFRKGIKSLVEGKNLETGEGIQKVSSKSLGKALMASLLVGNYQIHTENVGVAGLKNQREFVVLDFGGAFRRPFFVKLFSSLKKLITAKEKIHGRFERDVAPETWRGKKYGAAYIKAFPKEVRESADYLAGAAEVVSNHTKLINATSAEVDYAVSSCGEKEFLRRFALELDTASAVSITSADQAKMFMINVNVARQFSLQAYLLHSELNAKRHVVDPTMLADHPVYFAIYPGKMSDDKKTDNVIKQSDIGEDFLAVDMTDVKKTAQFFIQRLQELSYGLKHLPQKELEFSDSPPKPPSELKRGSEEEQTDKQHLYQVQLSAYEAKKHEYEEKTTKRRDMLQEVEVLEDFLKKAVTSYDVKNNASDKEILIQACDESYRRIASAYKEFNQLRLEQDKTAFLMAVYKKSPVLKDVLMSLPDLDKKGKDEIVLIVQKLQARKDIDDTKKALQDVECVSLGYAQCRALLVENWTRDLAQELNQQNIPYGIDQIKEKIEKAGDSKELGQIFTSYPAERQQAIKDIKNINAADMTGSKLTKFLQRWSFDQPLPEVITQQKLISWLNEGIAEDKIKGHLALALKNPAVCERLLLGQKTSEKKEGSKLIARLFAYAVGKPNVVKDMQAADEWTLSSKLTLADDRDITPIQGALFHFLQNKTVEENPDRAVIKMYDQALSIVQQRWIYLQSKLELASKDFKPLFATVSSVFAPPPLPSFIGQSSLYKLIEAYPHIAAEILVKNDEWLNNLFRGDKEKGKDFAIRLLADTHVRIVSGHHDNDILLQVKLLRGFLENNAVALMNSAEKNAIQKALYILSIQHKADSYADPNAVLKMQVETFLAAYQPLLDEYQVKKEVEHDPAFSYKEAANQIRRINAVYQAHVEADYVSHLGKGQTLSLLRMANKFWTETPEQQASHSTEERMLNLSAQHLETCQLQMNLVKRLREFKDLSSAETAEIYKAVLITDLREKSSKGGLLYPDQINTLEAARFDCKNFVYHIDRDIEQNLEVYKLKSMHEILLDYNDDQSKDQSKAIPGEIYLSIRDRSYFFRDYQGRTHSGVLPKDNELGDYFDYQDYNKKLNKQLKNKILDVEFIKIPAPAQEAEKLWDKLCSNYHNASMGRDTLSFGKEEKNEFSPLDREGSFKCLVAALEKSTQMYVDYQNENVQRAQRLFISMNAWEEAQARARAAEEREGVDQVLEQQRREERQKQQAVIDQAKDDAILEAAEPLRVYLDGLAEKLANNQAARNEVESSPHLTEFFAHHPQYQHAHAQLQIKPTEVSVYSEVRRQIVSSNSMKEYMNKPMIEADVSTHLLKSGEIAINLVIDNKAHAGKVPFAEAHKGGCYIERLSAQNKYQIIIQRMPEEISSRAAVIKMAGEELELSDEDTKKIQDVFKQYKEFMPTLNGVENLIRPHTKIFKEIEFFKKYFSQHNEGKVMQDIAHFYTERLQYATRQMMQPSPLSENELVDPRKHYLVPNDAYLGFASKQIETFIAAVGITQPIYICPNPDPLMVISFIVLCEARGITYKNASGVRYEPGQKEIDYVQNNYLLKGEAANALKQLNLLKTKVDNPDEINKLEVLIKKVGSGVLLTEQDKGLVQEIMQAAGNRRPSPRLGG